MRSKSYFFLLMVIALGAISGFLFTRFDFKFGLDVKGGVRFIYQIDASKLTPEQRSNMAAVRSKTQTILINRATGSFGVAEPVIVPKGEDQFVIELPGYTNIDQARATIGTSASIYFYWARNVQTEQATTRPYIPVESGNADNPEVWFKRTDTPGDPIKPGDPRYEAIIRGWGEPIIKGDQLASAAAMPYGGGYVPLMNFSAAGAANMEEFTRRNLNRGERLAAVLDGRVLSIARVEDGQILRDSAHITGTFTPEYVRKLVDLLNAGSLPVDLKELSSQQVDPSIGQQALDKMVFAGMISFTVIAAFLLVYYAFPGLVALVALLLYVLFTLTVLKLIGATFSLAAIAGFILSVGMAVDANILVFERFKEEVKSGKSLVTAIELGFRRAFPAILDSNVCTIVTSLVLAGLGTGPVKGFATTLIIGVAVSLFTAITVTRSLLMFLVGSGIGTNPKLYALERNWFGEKFEAHAESDPLHVVQKTPRWMLISLVTILIGLPFIFMGGLRGNVEFRGGYEASFAISGRNVTAAEIEKSLEAAGVHGANIKFGGEGDRRVAIVTASADGALQGLDESAAIQKLTTAAGFKAEDVRDTSSVGAAIQRETISNAILAVLISAGAIILYLTFRFGTGLGGFAAGLKFGFSAIGALLHDVLVVIGITAMVGYWQGWEVSGLFITSMLTVIGFSVHDTIVIFDRIRENLHRPLPNEDFTHLVNRSITQSFARSINTSMTVIVTLGILLFFGTTTPDLKLFCVTMLAGILSGTYSSIYNASPILWMWNNWVIKNRGEEHGFMAIAAAEIARNRKVSTAAAPQTVANGPSATSPDGSRTYGQVKRRVRASDRAKRELDD